MSNLPIFVTISEQSERFLFNRPSLSSAALGWQRITLEYRCLGAGAMP